jgi:trans-2,3-dihydro-3-hydroxyanthranilate isomerase
MRTDISVKHHAPVIASVGLPFLIAEIETREALTRARPRADAFARHLPRDGADAIYIYTRRVVPGDGQDIDFSARMFAPSDGLPEDPATGSATGAAMALVVQVNAEIVAHQRMRVAQGVDMGRPCLLEIEVGTADDGRSIVRMGGACIEVMEGTIKL